MKKSLLNSAIVGILSITPAISHAALSSSAALVFDNTDSNASGFVLGIAPFTPINAFNGVVIGTTQPASGAHGGPPNGSESPDIDMPWFFFNATGMHQTTSPIDILTDDGAGNVTLDFSGWNVDLE